MADRTPQEINAEIISKRKKPQPVQIGEIFGRLTVIAKGEPDKSISRFVCECACGQKILTRGSSLRNGHVKSCGCLKIKYTDENRREMMLKKKKEWRRKNRHKDKEYNKTRKSKETQSQAESRKAYHREYYRKNLLKIKKYNAKRHKDQTFRESRKSYMRKYVRRRKTQDIKFKIICGIRKRLNLAIRNNTHGSAIRDLGCTLEFFKQYIESQFRPGMSWDNWGKFTWHLDHIKPLSSFDLSDRQQFLEACHYTNMRPLWAIENLKKGAKVA